MAQMTAQSINDLPDSAFAYIEPGGTKDSSGKTTPRSLRHFPIHDEAHVRNALARAPQSPFGDKAMPKIRTAAKRMGIQVADTPAGRSYEEGSTVAAVERRFTLVPVEMRGTGSAPKIGGYAAVFNKFSRNLGGFVEIVTPGFFNKSRGDGWPDVMARHNHDDNMLLGTTAAGTLSLSVDDVGLLYEVVPPHSRADVVESVGRGDVRKSSFAFRAAPNGGDDWGMSEQGYPQRSLVSGALIDVATVTSPAYVDSSAGLRSLAAKFEADLDEVRSLAEADELRKFFVRTDGPQYVKPKPRAFGPAAALALLARRSDPWE